MRYGCRVLYPPETRAKGWVGANTCRAHPRSTTSTPARASAAARPVRGSRLGLPRRRACSTRSSQPKASCPRTCRSTAHEPCSLVSQSCAPLGLGPAGSCSIQTRRSTGMRTAVTMSRRRWSATPPCGPCRPLCPAQGLWRCSGWRCCSRRSTRLNASTADRLSTTRGTRWKPSAAGGCARVRRRRRWLTRQERSARRAVAARSRRWARCQPSHAPPGRSAAGGCRPQVAWPSLRSSHGVTTAAARAAARAARAAVRAARARRSARQAT